MGTDTPPGSGTISPRESAYALTWYSVPAKWFREGLEPVSEPVGNHPAGHLPGVPRGGFA